MYGIEHATAIRTAVNVNVVRRTIRRLLPVDAVKIGEREWVVPAHSNEIRSKRSPGGKRASRNKERTRVCCERNVFSSPKNGAKRHSIRGGGNVYLLLRPWRGPLILYLLVTGTDWN